MRILVTQRGDAVVRELTEMHDDLIHTRARFKKQSHKPQSLPRAQKIYGENSDKNPKEFGKTVTSAFSHNFTARSKKGHQKLKGELLEKLEMDQTAISAEELHQAKHIKINLNKIQFPKRMSDKYDNPDIKSTATIIGANTFLPAVTKKTQEQMMIESTSEDMGRRTKYSMKEIMNQTAYNTLRSKMISEKKMRDKMSRIDETKFRTPYETKNILERMDGVLSRKINPDRTNLIRYLNQKMEMSEVALRKLAEYDEEKINRVNKICQIVLHNADREKLLKDIIKGKMKANGNMEKMEYQKRMDEMEEEMRKFQEKLKEHEKKINNHERYKDIHKDLAKNYWGRYNLDRLQKRGKRSPERKLKGSESQSQLPGNVGYGMKMIMTDSTDLN